MNTLFFSDYILDWLKLKKTTLEPNTYITYERQVKLIANYFHDRNLLVKDMTYKEINLFYSYLSLNGMSNARILKFHSNLYSAVKSLVADDILPHSILLKIDRPKTQKYLPNLFTDYDIQTLSTFILTNITDDLFAPVCLALFLGLRRSEALGLNWDNINLNNGEVLISQKVVEGVTKSDLIISKNMKTSSSRRILKMPDFLIPYFTHLKNYQCDINTENNKQTNFVCINKKSELILPSYVTRKFKKLCTKLDIKSVRYHDLRHTNASMLLDLGSNMKDIQIWLGHSDFQTTANIYTHVTSKSKDKLAGLLDKHFSPIKK